MLPPYTPSGCLKCRSLEAEFHRRLPAAKLEVQYLRPEKIYEYVGADRVDLGLVSYPEPTREIAVLPWRSEEMVLTAAPDAIRWPLAIAFIPKI